MSLLAFSSTSSYIVETNCGKLVVLVENLQGQETKLIRTEINELFRDFIGRTYR